MIAWTDEEIDALLDEVLVCDSRLAYNRTLIGAAIARQCGEDVLNRFLWGLATGVRVYAGPARVARSGPPTYTDIMIVKWATKSQSEGKKIKTDPAYVAKILRRSENEVRELWKEYGPARGRSPLFPDLST